MKHHINTKNRHAELVSASTPLTTTLSYKDEILNQVQDDFRKGFTLIELLVVVLIIGILAAVALPQYRKAVLKSRAAQAFVQLKALENAQIEYYLSNGTYTPNKDALAIETLGVCGGAEGSVVYCTISALKSGDIQLEWDGYADGSKTWVCLAAIDNSYANSICETYQADWEGTVQITKKGYNYYLGVNR